MLQNFITLTTERERERGKKLAKTKQKQNIRRKKRNKQKTTKTDQDQKPTNSGLFIKTIIKSLGEQTKKGTLTVILARARKLMA